MYIYFFVLFFGLACSKKPSSTVPPVNHTYQSEDDVKQFLRTAVLNGLKEDAVSQDIASIIIKNSSSVFVYQCPICTPVKKAFSLYSPPSGESKLPSAIENEIKGDKEQRKKGLQKLVSMYVQRHLKRLQVQGKALTNLENNLKKMRKKGMEEKDSNFGDNCPNCDGACRIPEM